MLINCPECNHEISDKALSCPHCGYPMTKPETESEPTPKPTKSSKRMRLPNGFGRITKITGKRLRKPFRAVVTTGKHYDGRLITKLIGYYTTYNDAYQALLEYHKDPTVINEDITIEELYNRWYEKWSQKKSQSTIKNIRNAWRYCSSLYKVNARDIRIWHIKECILNGTAPNKKGEMVNASTFIRHRMKILLTMILDYAIEYDIVKHNYARDTNISNEETTEYDGAKRIHKPFTDEEFEILLKHTDIEIVRLIVINCYTGFRPNEFLTIPVKNVNLEKGYIQHGEKTDAGKDRIVPIHSKIESYIKELMNIALTYECEYLVTYEKKNISYGTYIKYFKKAMKNLGIDESHYPHDCRVTFTTRAKKYEVNEYSIKRIVGHAINDVTENVYTKRDPEWLKKEIEKIP